MTLNSDKDEDQVVHKEAEKLALEEEIFKERVGELWAEMYGQYRYKTEVWWMHLDQIHD